MGYAEPKLGEVPCATCRRRSAHVAELHAAYILSSAYRHT